MAYPCGQARLAGQAPGIDGDPTLSARLRRAALALVLVLQGLAASAALAQPPEPPTAPSPRRVVRLGEAGPSAAARDSLMLEIRKYSALINDLRDSLGTDLGEIRLSEAQRARLERSIGEFSGVIERIGAELGRMEFEVKDNTISLLDEAGQGIRITIPENLDERLSEGFHALSELILSELPDTVRVDARRHLTWLGQRPPRPPRAERRVVKGNVVKIWDDLLVPWGEDVRGDVVVVFGNAEVQGRVDGNVVVVLGGLQLGDGAEVTGQVVTVGGRLEQDEGAVANDVFVFDPIGARRGFSPLAGHGVGGFLLWQSLFVVMLVVALAAAIAAPDRRFRAVQQALQRSPVEALGVGALAAVAAHLLVLVLVGVLVLTVIGIPVALLVWLALLVGGVIATAVAAAAVGERVCRGRRGGCPSRWLAVLVGMLLLHTLSFLGSLLGVVPGATVAATAVSLAGVMVKLAAYVVGVGALTLSRFGTKGGLEPGQAEQ